MWPSKRNLISGLAAVASGVILGSKRAALAQPQSDVVAELANGEGIFVDGKTFKVAKGKPKGDPIAQIARLGAREVGPGAIIYMVEAIPPGVSMQSMKSFQDDSNVSYMNSVKDF